MRILTVSLILSIAALSATPSDARTYHKRHHYSRTVNGAGSALPANGQRKVTRTGGPAGGSANQ